MSFWKWHFWKNLLQNAEIKNLNINAEFTAGSREGHVAGVVVNANGVDIENVNVFGTLTGSGYSTGGIVANMGKADGKNANNNGTDKKVENKITNCTNNMYISDPAKIDKSYRSWSKSLPIHRPSTGL